jgi:hypothetical protein
VTAVAHTNTALFRQLAAAGWTSADLDLAHRAYGLARTLVPGLFNGDGRPFVNHFVSVASLLQHYRRPPTTVIAGLLHSIYAHGDFGLLCSFADARARIRTVSVPVEIPCTGFTCCRGIHAGSRRTGPTRAARILCAAR